MKLGTGLFTAQDHPDDPRLGQDRYEDLLELTRVAEDAGLDSAWTSEHHFEEDAYLSASMPVLAAMAAETDSIELGPCVALGPLYNPVRLAEDAATVDLLAEGRLTMGLAIGSNPREFEALGIPEAERTDRLEELLPMLRGAWSDGPLEYDSSFYDISPDVSVTPKPDIGTIPIVLGGSSKPAVRRAARHADGWIAPSSLSLAGLRKRVEDIRSVRDEEDIQGEFSIYVLQHGWVDDSRVEAWEAMQDGYLYLQRRYAEIFSGDAVQHLDGQRKRELKEQAIFGPPEEVADELQAYRDELGDDIHFIFRTYYPGVETEETAECIRRLGEHVAPRLRDLDL
jgi:alkanesulfonate monooxygenase SsuD/methylene tetrahydromethanopterin reductase-like flavin-dependent oxidoreductase (luciferase family)